MGHHDSYWAEKLKFMKDDENYSEKRLARCTKSEDEEATYPCIRFAGADQDYNGAINSMRANGLKSLNKNFETIKKLIPYECDGRFPRLTNMIALYGKTEFRAHNVERMATRDPSFGKSSRRKSKDGSGKSFKQCLEEILSCTQAADSTSTLSGLVQDRIREIFSVVKQGGVNGLNPNLAAVFSNPTPAELEPPRRSSQTPR